LVVLLHCSDRYSIRGDRSGQLRYGHFAYYPVGGVAEHSGIEWTEATWNPTSGCTKISPGCERCYAERVARRFPKTFPNGFALTLRPAALDLPLHWRRPRMIFVNSMSDLFHVRVPDSYIADVFDVMARCPQHTFQVLTKRAIRLARLSRRLPWPRNVWMGVSVECADFSWRIDWLRSVPAALRFVSAEPLLGPLPSLNLDGIHWLIAGGESQAGARPAHLDWFRDLRDQCRAVNVAFFLKQLGGHPSKRGGEDAVLDGRRWVELPYLAEPQHRLSLAPRDRAEQLRTERVF
jgi:protein gp37